MKKIYILLFGFSLVWTVNGQVQRNSSTTNTSTTAPGRTSTSTNFQMSPGSSSNTYTPPPNNNNRDPRGGSSSDYGSDNRGGSNYTFGGGSGNTSNYSGYGGSSSGSNSGYNSGYNNYNGYNSGSVSTYSGSNYSGTSYTPDYSTTTSRSSYIAPCATCFPNMYAAPQPKYRVHFNGRLLSDVDKASVSGIIWQDDESGEILGLGRYPYIKDALKESVQSTFDGIAIDENTRLIIYKGENFTGDTLIDITGPALINNSLWKNRADEFGAPNTKDFSPELQVTFPQNRRFWSEYNMHTWQDGSMEILQR